MEEVTVRLNKESGPEELQLSFPSKWDELSQQQLLYIAKYYQSWHDLARIGDSLQKARALLLIELCGLSSMSEKRKLCHFLSFVDEHTNVSILCLTDFVFEFGKVNLTVNKLPKIKVGMFTWLYGPGDRLKDVTIGEFSFAFTAYQRFTSTQVESHLNDLVGVLYRPENPDYKKTGEIRKPFSNTAMKLYMDRIRKLDIKYRYAVLLYFTGCMTYLAGRYPRIFRRAEKDEKSGGNFYDTVRHMSGGKFGPLDAAQNTNLYIFLQEMQELMIQQENEARKKR